MIGKYRNCQIALSPVTGTIGSMILQRAVEWPNHAVFAERRGDEDYVPVSWHSFMKQIVSVVEFFHKEGIRKGDRIAVFSPNCFEMLVWEMAVTSMGAISVPIFQGYDTVHLDYIIHHAEPRAIMVTDDERLAKVEECTRRSSITLLVTRDDSHYVQYEEICDGGSSELLFKLNKEVTPDDVCFIQYTSGTTGNPKGVMLTHRNIISQRKALEKIWDVSHESRFLSFLPWHHSFGGLFERFSALYHGATIYMEDSFGRDINRLIQNWTLARPTQFFSVPKIYIDLVNEARMNPELKETLFHPELKFVFTAAAPLPHDCGEYFKSQGIRVMEGWGLTETSPCVTITMPGTQRVHSYVGEPIPGSEIMTTEDNEILVKGPQVMKGYYRDPEKTAETIDHYGWLHTGDLGEINDFGLRMICRVDGMFKLSNGEKVSSMEVENALTIQAFYVLHALALGSGENHVGAMIFPNYRNLEAWAEREGKKLAEGWDLSADPDVQKLIATEIGKNMVDLQPKYMVVKAFVIVPKELRLEDGELTPTMKVIRKTVEEKYEEWGEAIFHPDKHKDKQQYIVRI